MKQALRFFMAALLLYAAPATSFSQGGATGKKPSVSLKQENMNNKQVRYQTTIIDGVSIFYREAGNRNKPALLLLHGFPSSSHMYRDLITDLADDYYIIAPDYPGFGQSSMPPVNEYEYTFDNLATTITHLINNLGLKKFSLYVQDYGGPVGFRIAAKNPEMIQAIIVQNANAYEEGLGEALKPLVDYIQQPNEQTEAGARSFLSFEATKWQYTDGAEDLSRISPDSYISDQHYLDRPGNDVIQLALFRNYGSNLPLYAAWQAYFRKHKPATLVISGKNDKLFIAPGAEAFRKDNPDAQISLLNGGHFALEEHHVEAARLIKVFLSKHNIQ